MTTDSAYYAAAREHESYLDGLLEHDMAGFCEHCQQIAENCECEICDSCGEPGVDCECHNCPVCHFHKVDCQCDLPQDEDGEIVDE